MKIAKEILECLLIIFAFAYLDAIFEAINGMKSKASLPLWIVVYGYIVIKIFTI